MGAKSKFQKNNKKDKKNNNNQNKISNSLFIFTQ